MSQPMTVPTKPPSGNPPARRAPEATIPPVGSKLPPRPSGRVVKDTATAPARLAGLPRLPSLEMEGEAPEVHAEMVEIEEERLRDDAPTVVKPSESEPSSKPPPLPGKTSQLHLVPPRLPAQGPSSGPSVAARASSIPPIPKRATSSAPSLAARPAPSVPPAHVTSSFPAVSAQTSPSAPTVSVVSSPVATRPAAPAVPPGVDEVRALVRAAQGVVGELDHMIQEMERRLADPTRWAAQPGPAPASPDASAAFAKASLPPPAAPPTAALPTVMVAATGSTTASWWESERHRRIATFGVGFSLAVGLGGLALALLGSC